MHSRLFPVAASAPPNAPAPSLSSLLPAPPSLNYPNPSLPSNVTDLDALTLFIPSSSASLRVVTIGGDPTAIDGPNPVINYDRKLSLSLQSRVKPGGLGGSVLEGIPPTASEASALSARFLNTYGCDYYKSLQEVRKGGRVSFSEVARSEATS